MIEMCNNSLSLADLLLISLVVTTMLFCVYNLQKGPSFLDLDLMKEHKVTYPQLKAMKKKGLV